MSSTNDDAGLMIHCPAKLNLTLAVAPPREDGLHPIASVMVPLIFSDALSLTRRDAGPSTFERAWGPNAPRTSPIDWPIEKDLAYRAHALLEDEAGESLPVDCRLLKNIPVGAGLGGGSSNAAGMLVGLRDLFRLDVSDARLSELGQALGADVGFAVYSVIHRRAALASGIGQVLASMDALPTFHTVLVFPEGGCPTGEVYRAFDGQPGSSTPPDRLAALAQQWRSLTDLPELMNDLTEAAAAVCPAIGRATEVLNELGLRPHLTGSGSTLFVLAHDEAQAQQTADRCRQAGLCALATRFDGCL